MSNVARLLVLPFAVGAALVFTAIPGCSDDAPPDSFNPANNGKKDGGSSGGNDSICLLNNCDKDRDCADCSDGATVCLQSEHRCVACGPQANGKTCASGQTCTKYGNCVGPGIACAEDAKGVPTITCKNTADCGACGPKFRVCDDATHKCVGCSDTNTTNCQSTEVCKTATGTCTAKCPAACNTDDECSQCGGPGAPAHACNNHICSECSATKACEGANKGKTCDISHGKCISTCGLGRPGVSNCGEDGNCSACLGTTKCKLPANHTDGDPDGTCSVPATGCSDIGKGIIVLPDPFSRFTNTCSTDTDCAGQGADLNVGKILRDATGVDLIKDGNLSYGMHACASVEVLDKSCGVCVPCKTDRDCEDIDVAKVGGDIFGPVGSVAASVLLDKAFGPNDHKVHTYCQNVAGNYGVCLPCGDILHACGEKAKDALPPNTNCDHDVCATGKALGLQCGVDGGSACVAQVCAKDPYCCDSLFGAWDETCKLDVDHYCDDKTCTPNSCAYRSAGWYCNTDGTQGGYKCAGDGTDPSPTTADGHQCPDDRKCQPKDASKPKSLAVLCDTEAADSLECPIGSKGKPKCVQ
jgi:hypothetical protein